MAVEEFWLALTKRSPDGINLTELTIPFLTPALIRFLCSFRGLEKFILTSAIIPVLPSSSTSSWTQAMTAELRLLDAVSDNVLPAHQASLRYLALCPNVAWRVECQMTPERVGKIARCTSLSVLHLPITSPEDDLVCAQNQPSTCAASQSDRNR